MEIKFNITDLKDKKVMVATPMYGGQCAGMFCKSAIDLGMIAGKYGVDVRYYYLFNESLITRARNYCVDEFLRSDATHLLFIDSDIGFNPKDVLTLLYLCSEDEYSIITGPYPKKTIAWEKIKVAVEKGFADDNPFNLENFVGDYVFNPASGQTSFSISEPVKVNEAGTGFMMIHRSVFDKYKEAYPELSYKPDHVRTEHFDGSREIMAYFDVVIDPETKRYLSEDYMFCYNARKIGIPVWLCPWMELKHVGTYTFGGSLAAISSINASPTASKESNIKSYNKAVAQTPVDIQEKEPAMNRHERRKAAKKKGK